MIKKLILLVSVSFSLFSVVPNSRVENLRIIYADFLSPSEGDPILEWKQSHPPRSDRSMDKRMGRGFLNELKKRIEEDLSL